MRKSILFLVISLTLASACDKIAAKQNQEQLNAIEEARKKAIEEINETKIKSVNDASNTINIIISEALQNADNQIATAISAAEDKISNSVRESTAKAIDNKIQPLGKRVSIIQLLAILGILLALIIFAIVLVLKNRMFKSLEDYVKHCVDKKLHNIHQDERDIKLIVKKEIADVSWSKMKNASPGLSIKDINSLFYSDEFQNKIISIVRNELKSNISIDQNPPAVVNEPSTIVSTFEQFARDSRTEELNEISSSYMVGKTVYRLIMLNQESNNAEIDLCIDKDDAKRRIIQNGENLLVPICSVSRVVAEPSNVVVIERGKAERIDTGKWRVTKKICVELN